MAVHKWKVPALEMYRIDCLKTETEVLALKKQYQLLVRSLPDVPIFLDWDWMDTWWRNYGQDDMSLWVLTARNKTGQIVGIAPWIMEKQRLGLIPKRRITFLGSGQVNPCHLCIIAEKNDQKKIFNSFLTYLNNHLPEWDLVELEGVTGNSVPEQNIAGTKGRFFERIMFSCPYIFLPEDWETFQKRLSKKLLRNLRYFRNRLYHDNPGHVDFHRVMEADELIPAIDTLISLHRKRWHAKGEATCFDDTNFIRFHRDLALMAQKLGWLRFYQLKVNDEVIAAFYSFRYRDVFYAYQIGFDLSWRRYSPGRILIAHVIQEAIKERARVFDWLRGEQEFKFDWTHDSQPNYHILFSANYRGHFWLYKTALHYLTKSLVKKIRSEGK